MSVTARCDHCGAAIPEGEEAGQVYLYKYVLGSDDEPQLMLEPRDYCAECMRRFSAMVGLTSPRRVPKPQPGKRKITVDVDRIRQLRKEGLTAREIAAACSCSINSVWVYLREVPGD